MMKCIAAIQYFDSKEIEYTLEQKSVGSHTHIFHSCKTTNPKEDVSVHLFAARSPAHEPFKASLPTSNFLETGGLEVGRISPYSTPYEEGSQPPPILTNQSG